MWPGARAPDHVHMHQAPVQPPWTTTTCTYHSSIRSSLCSRVAAFDARLWSSRLVLCYAPARALSHVGRLLCLSASPLVLCYGSTRTAPRPGKPLKFVPAVQLTALRGVLVVTIITSQLAINARLLVSPSAFCDSRRALPLLDALTWMCWNVMLLTYLLEAHGTNLLPHDGASDGKGGGSSEGSSAGKCDGQSEGKGDGTRDRKSGGTSEGTSEGQGASGRKATVVWDLPLTSHWPKLFIWAPFAGARVSVLHTNVTRLQNALPLASHASRPCTGSIQRTSEGRLCNLRATLTHRIARAPAALNCVV